MTTVTISFGFCLLIFAVIGVLSALKNKHTTKDYLLAGQNVQPWLVSLSAVATNNSGYMFIGMIGYTYVVGLSAAWVLIGWIFGDFIASLLIHRKVRLVSQKKKLLSFSGLISGWYGKDYKVLRMISGVITIIFLGIYAAAQLKAGSKALHTLFDWDYYVGALIGAVIVLLYCLSGGIRASIWTDAAQSFVMIVAMFLLVIFSINATGGYDAFVAQLNDISPSYLNIFPLSESGMNPIITSILFVTGWVFAGFGVAGQPHIMVRFMVMNKARDMAKVRYYYYSWFSIFSILTVLVGLSARILIPEIGFDAELALPMLSMQLLPQALVGLVLAGLFAATMSTADSQILSCCASLTNDFGNSNKSSYLVTKLGTVLVVSIALVVALNGGDNVFNLVLVAWSVLACAFAPLIVVYSLGGKPSENLAIMMMAAGIGTVFYWKHLGFGDIIYEVAPGIISALLVYLISKLIKSSKIKVLEFKK
jgi:sodium/proline symporter